MDMMQYYVCIQSHNMKELTKLCAKNKKYDYPHNQYYYPLHLAIEKGFLDVVELLVQSGATINYNYKESPLCAAVRFRKHEIMNFLLDQGADVSLLDEILFQIFNNI